MFVIDYKIKVCDHGIGIFSDQFVPRHSLVFKMGPRSVLRIGYQEFNNMGVSMKRHVKKYAYSDGRTIHLPILHDMFLNHSSDPNIAKDFWGEDDYAVRDILPGEQIFCNYLELETSGVFCSEFLHHSRAD